MLLGLNIVHSSRTAPAGKRNLDFCGRLLSNTVRKKYKVRRAKYEVRRTQKHAEIAICLFRTSLFAFRTLYLSLHVGLAPRRSPLLKSRQCDSSPRLPWRS